MRKTKTLLAAAILAGIAFAGYSQAQTTTGTATTGTAAATPAPNPNAGTYADKTLSIPQRLQLANTVLGSGTTPQATASAAAFILNCRPIINVITAFPKFADSVIADPTLSGTVTDPNTIGTLYMYAVAYKTDSILVLNDKVAYLQPLLSSTLYNVAQANQMKNKYGTLVTAQAQLQFNAGDYAGAITTAAPVLGFGGSGAIMVTFNAKVALRSSDVLSWAKLVYETQIFQNTQAGIDAVSSAFRSLDTNLVRANAFIQYQKDGVGTNPLASVTLPQVTFLGTSPAVLALNSGITGDNLAALKIAVNAFATAPSGPALNTATGFVAQWLRNIDGNLVRPNAFVSAQSAGQTFTIAELTGSN